MSQIQESLNEGIELDFSDGFVGEMEIAEESLKSFLKTWDGTGDIAEQYQQYLTKASSSTAKFAATLKSVAVNMAIMLAINLAIKAAAEIWDYYNVTVEETQKEIDTITDKLSTLNGELEDLQSKDPTRRTDAEKARIKYLKERIELEEQLPFI